MIKVFSDSTCDLSPELLEQYNISILPLHIHLGDKVYEDGRGIQPDDIYKWSDAHRETPKTAACDPAAVYQSFRNCLEEGHEIVALTISEKMSGTANIMRLAAKELNAQDRVHVVESANLSTGVGHLAITASELAAQGKSSAEIAARLEQIKPLVRASFVVDTLTYLHRGGRCSGVSAFVGSTLKLHPLIKVENGQMRPDKKYRGKMTKVIDHYVRDLEEDLKKANPDRVFITHSGCNENDVQMVYDYLNSLHHFNHIYITRAGGVISSHCGPGTLGVLYVDPI